MERCVAGPACNICIDVTENNISAIWKNVLYADIWSCITYCLWCFSQQAKVGKCCAMRWNCGPKHPDHDWCKLVALVEKISVSFAWLSLLWYAGGVIWKVNVQSTYQAMWTECGFPPVPFEVSSHCSKSWNCVRKNADRPCGGNLVVNDCLRVWSLFPYVCLQDLCTAAEPLRQDEVKKTTLKNLLWEKTLIWIRATPSAQTGEIPVATARATAAEWESKKSKTSAWEPDALWQEIAKSVDSATELEVAAHHYVESVLIPKFCEGMPVDIVHKYNTNAWDNQVQDRVCWMHRTISAPTLRAWCVCAWAMAWLCAIFWFLVTGTCWRMHHMI